MNKDRYVALLEKLIGETELLQDNPPKFIPQEDRYVFHDLNCYGFQARALKVISATLV